MKKVVTTTCLVVLSLLLNLSAAAQIGGFDKRARKFTQTSVKYNKVEAVSDGNGVYLKWQTESETKNTGFLVYRVSGENRELVSPTIITGALLQTGQEESVGGEYSFFDLGGDLNSVYLIENIGADGKQNFSNPISVAYTNDLEETEKARAAAENKTQSLIEDSALNMPKDLHGEYKNAQDVTNINVHRMVVNQPGVKIGVKKEGLYRISRADLQTAGFNVAANSNLWQLYLNGVEQSIIVGANGSYVEFYGKGIDTPESDTRIYYLTVGAGNGKRVGNFILRPISGKVVAASYNQSIALKERTVYVNSGIFNGDAENYYGRAVTSSGATVSFNLSAVSFADPFATLEVSVQGITSTPHSVKIAINGEEQAVPLVGSGLKFMSGVYKIPTSALREGANQLKLTATAGVSLFDQVIVTNNRRYVAEQNRLLFYSQNYKAANLENFTSANVRVFDTTDSANIRLLSGLKVEQNGATFTAYIPSNRGRAMYATEDSAVLSPASLTSNTPSLLASPGNNADLVIISHKNFLVQAEEWANYRRSQGTYVRVIDVEDLYDEFSYGVVSAYAIRGFLQYAAGNWGTAPRYALFIGDATSDPRNYLGAGNFNFVPTKLVDTVYTETGSDEALADFNDDGLSEIAVGRIPARTTQEITNALAKVSKFEQNIEQASSRGALFASDLPDGYDFAGLSQRLSNQLPAAMAKAYVNRAQADAGTALISEINKGKFLVNYSGHGNVSTWASTAFFTNNSIAQLNNTNNLSLFTMLTCLNGYFIQPTGDSLSELLLKSTSGGAVAVWSSTGLTTPDIQETMGIRFYQQIAEGKLTRLGDLIKDAKSTIESGRDVRLSWALLGDPMLRMK